MKQHELTKAHQKAVQIARGSLMSTHNDADEVFTHDILEDEDILEDRIANVS